MPPRGRERYGPALEHLGSMSQGSDDSRILASPERVATRLADIVDRPKPRQRYSLAFDARLIDRIVTRLVPFGLRAAATKRMYRINGTPVLPSVVATTQSP